MKRHFIISALIIVLPVLAGIKTAQAEAITFYPTQVLGHGTPPAGVPPWIAATFDDHGGQGLVTLTLATLNLTDDEFVSKWLFNLNPSLDPSELRFSDPIKTGSFRIDGISAEEDEFHGGGGDRFDIRFSFSTHSGHSRRFDAGDAMQVNITGIPTLRAASFNFNSEGRSHYDDDLFPATTEAHIQGIGDCRNDSAWIVAPEPSSLCMAFWGLLGMALYRLKDKQGK